MKNNLDWSCSHFMQVSRDLDKGYTPYRCDRPGRVGGGVLLAINNSLNFRRRYELESDLEMVCIEINVDNSPKILLSTIYRPPDSTPSKDFDSVNKIAEFLDKSTRILKGHSIVLGDFNYPSISWTNQCGFSNSLNSADFAFCEILSRHSLLQINPFPTRKGNILDLIITNEPDRITNIEPLSPAQAGLFTDHDLLEFDILSRLRRIPKPARTVYNFKSTDFNALKADILQSSDIKNSLYGNDIDICWRNWKKALLMIIDSNVPKIKLREANTPPWIDKEVLHLLKKKETARRAARKHNTIHFLNKFKSLRRQVKALINVKLKDYHNSLGDYLKDNPKRFWSYFRHKTKSNSIPANVVYNEATYCSPKDKAEAFNKFFHSTFTHDPVDLLAQCVPPDLGVPSLTTLQVTEDEVLQVLLRLDHSKAPGPDGLPTRILKECAKELSPSICQLFNISLATGTLPLEWKESNVVPVHKKGKKEDVTNYRPISLLCVISKVLERCIHNHLKDHLLTLIDDFQHGFLQGRSTVTQLLSFYHEIGRNLDKGLQSDVILLDLAKAFDSVSHLKLLSKLSTYGIQGPLLQWFESYLIGRSQRCLVHGCVSSSSPVPSGVPQGSILGPL